MPADGPGAKSTDLGFAVGGGIGVPAGRGHGQIIGRYLLGLGDAFEEEWDEGQF